MKSTKIRAQNVTIIFNILGSNVKSEPYSSPQGGILGGISYSTGSYDNTEAIEVDDEDKYQYVDDLNLLELIIMSDILIQYNF